MVNMDKIRVLMIDDNINLTEMVKEYFSNHSKIEVVMCSYDGEDGIKKIINENLTNVRIETISSTTEES